MDRICNSQKKKKLPCPLGRGQKVCHFVCQSVTLSPPKPLDEVQPNFVCELLTNERYIHVTYQTGFSFGRLGHASGLGLGGTGRGGGSKKKSKIQPNLVCELLT